MTELQNKARNWRALKALYNQYNITLWITYRSSNSTVILREIARIRTLQPTLQPRPAPRQQNRISRDRSVPWWELKRINPNNKLAYKYASYDDIISEFKAERKNMLNHVIDNGKLKTFFNVPVALKSITITANNINYLAAAFKMQPNFKILLQVGYDAYELKPENVHHIAQYFNDDVIVDYTDGSDTEAMIMGVRLGQEKLYLTWISASRERKAGAFFKYFNKMEKVDLTRYQIYNKGELQTKLNCLQYALKTGGLCEEKFNKMITLFIKTNDQANIANNDKIPKRFITFICEQLKINIILSYMGNHATRGNVIVREPYPKTQNKDNETFEIALVDGHYFINERTIYTKESIVNYDQLKDRENFNDYIFKSNRFRKDASKEKMMSINIVRLMLENKKTMLEAITYGNGGLDVSYHLNDFKNYTELFEPNDSECCEVLPGKTGNPPRIFKAKGGEYTPFDVVYFDAESSTNGKIHEAFMICSESREGKKNCFTGPYCAQDFLNSLKKNTLLIAHNMKYDLQFLIRHLFRVQDYIPAGSKCKTISGLYSKYEKKGVIRPPAIRICIKDSMSMIAGPLRDFEDMFKLDVKKEIMPYEIYTQKSVEKPYIRISSAKPFLSETDYEDFKQNIIDWKLEVGDNNFNHIEYSKIYCEMDVSVLKKGYEIFRGWMKEITDMDIDNLISIPQLAYYYGVNEFVFEGVYELSGQCREFIQRCVVGGRTMCRDNKSFHVKKNLQDFDAVSLYPSAMHRMEGLLMGKPKVITNLSYDFLKSVTGYFVEIEILDICKKRHFPLISRVNESGVRDFTNEIRGKGIYVDKQGLQDLIEFQDVKFKILRGYYFDEGRNDKIKEWIYSIFQERIIKKKAKNPIQAVYKLIMNSFYGKTIQNPILHRYEFVYGSQKHEDAFAYKSDEIICSTKIREGMYMIKSSNSIKNHFSLPQVGVEILSMSKHIMNEVICLAEDAEIKIYYQDTDSMHIENDGVERLNDLFVEKYNHQLIGEKLGQFHCDFDTKTFKIDEGAPLPISIESYFIGKKTYIDKIMHIHEGIEKIGHHIRCKGIPTKVITGFELSAVDVRKSTKNDMVYKPKKYNDLMNLYGDMYKGETIEFDLLNICKFKTNKNFTFSNNKSFTRVLKFGLEKGYDNDNYTNA
mgnify:CR=1 FL=1